MNHPMGPLQLADFIGLDTVLAIMETLYDGYADCKRNQVLNANSPFVITDKILEHHYHAFQEPCGEGEKAILQKEDIIQYSKEESKAIWNQNAEFWDCSMGDESNDFHREVVRPKVTELLNPDPTDYILDIACGNASGTVLADTFLVDVP